MKKRILKYTAIALCLLLALPVFQGIAVPAQALESGDWSYEEPEIGSVQITRYLGEAADVTIPAELDGKPVTAIGDGAVAGIRGIVSVTVPDSVETIGEEAFADCPDLVSITLPDSVTAIGRRAFRYCQKLESVTLPSTLSELPYQGFWDCQSLRSVVIPAGVAVIPNGCFYNCFALEKVTVPASVTAFEKNAFHACIHLEDITLTDDVTTIDPDAFSDCEWLIIYAPEGSIADHFAKENGFVSEPIYYETSHPYTEDDFRIEHTDPDSPAAYRVTFSSHTYVSGVFGMDQIVLEDADGNEFVYSGDSLAGKTVVLGGARFAVTLQSYFADSNVSDFGFRITAIEPMTAEEYADYLADLDANPWESHIVNGTVEITGYRGLKKDAVVPAKLNNISVTAIAANAFQNNRILTNVTIEDGVRRIGRSAFESCDALAEIQIPESVVEIGDAAFFGCGKLEALHIPDEVTIVPNDMACNCRALTQVTLPENLTAIGKTAFGSCHALQQIQIPDSVREIGEEAFSSTGLTALSLPEGLRVVPKKLCQSCQALAEVSIPSSVTEIQEYAFMNCSLLEGVAMPAGIKRIERNAFASTGLKTIDLPEGLETIGAIAFNGTKLTRVHIPSTVCEIGENPFSFCQSLTEITVSEDNPNYAAVDNCLCDKSGATLISCPGGFTGEFIVPDGITKLGRESCAGAAMTVLIVPESVTELEIGVFMQCPNLQYADVRATATSLPENFLSYCFAMTEVRLSDTITVLDKMAFYFCPKLETITLPASLKEIGNSAFYNSTSLKRVVLPAGLERVGTGAFRQCGGLSDVYYGGTEEQWNAIIFGSANDELKGANIHYAWQDPILAECVDGGSIRIGDRIVAVCAEAGEAVSVTPKDAQIISAGVTIEQTATRQVLTAMDENTAVLEVLDAGGGDIYLRCEQGYLTSAATGNGLSYAAEPEDCSKWQLRDGVFLYNPNASDTSGSSTYRNYYLEYFGGKFTTYDRSENSNLADFALDFYRIGNSVPGEEIEREPYYYLPVFETSDTHGWIADTSAEPYRYLLAFISDKVKDVRGYGDGARNDKAILLDGGDIYQGTILSNIQQGQSLSAAYAAMNYDAVTIGNHEFDWGIETTVDANKTMKDVIEEAYARENNTPVIVSNLYLNGEKVSFADDYIILEKTAIDETGSELPVRVGVIGFAGDYASSIMYRNFTGAGYAVRTDYAALNELASSLETSGACDATIVLTHEEAALVAHGIGEGSAIDLVLGGHTHVSAQGTTSAKLPYLQPASYGAAYAYSELAFSAEGGTPTFEKVVNRKTVSVTDNPEKLYNTPENADELDPAVVSVTDAAIGAVSEALTHEVGYITQPALRNVYLPDSGNRSTTMGNWATSIFARSVGAEVAFVNSGGLRTDILIPEGQDRRMLTLSDLYTMFPFNNKLYCYLLTYEDLLTALQYSLTAQGKTLLSQMTGIFCYFTDETVNAIVTADGQTVYANGVWRDGWQEKTLPVVVSEYIATTDRPDSGVSNPFVAWTETPRLINSELTDVDGAIATIMDEAKENGGRLRIDTTAYYRNLPFTAACGDMNGDGAIDVKDVLALRQYLAGGYGVMILTDAADVNHDGAINIKDLLLLRRYLAGGYGVALG